MSHFYEAEGIKKLRKLRDLKPDLFKAFVEFDAKVFEEGALSVKTKELIAVAAAHLTQCPYCIDAHTQRAKKAGVSETEVAEAIFVAMALRAGGSWAHSCIAMASLEKA
jgi:alkylhydroperoxidase/carboxymuconolactone decarboxylase family protein